MKLSLKDYLIIYLVILVIVSFIAGFFIGARTMENELKDYYNHTASKTTEKDLEEEISTFYYQLFLPARTYNMDVYELLSSDAAINEAEQETMINTGKELLINYDIYTFESSDLTSSANELYMSINMLLEALKNNNFEQTTAAFEYYLTGQKEFYHNIWTWEQSLNPDAKIVEKSQVDWKAWNKGNLHQKNYIVSTILEKKSIKTFHKPEDITVHIDSFNNNETDVSINLEDVISMLISSDSINDNDFIKYTNKYPDWYSSDILPEIINFH